MLLICTRHHPQTDDDEKKGCTGVVLQGSGQCQYSYTLTGWTAEKDSTWQNSRVMRAERMVQSIRARFEEAPVISATGALCPEGLVQRLKEENITETQFKRMNMRSH